MDFHKEKYTHNGQLAHELAGRATGRKFISAGAAGTSGGRSMAFNYPVNQRKLLLPLPVSLLLPVCLLLPLPQPL